MDKSGVRESEVDSENPSTTTYFKKYLQAREIDTPWIAPIHTEGPSFDEVYKVHEQIGQGGYGTVWRCTHRDSGMEIATKIIDLDELATMKKLFPRMIERELELTRDCQHPCVVQMVEVFDRRERGGHGGKLHLVMELCNGSSLQDIIDRVGALDEEEAKVVFAGIGSAVKHLHKRGTIHRDIKPGNIVVLSSGEGRREEDGSSSIERPVTAKLIDFGLARETIPSLTSGFSRGLIQRFSSKLTSQQTAELNKSISRRKLSMSACGTKAFAAPEMRDPDYGGMPGGTNKSAGPGMKEYGMNVDEFSLGQTLKAALTGCPPDIPASDYIASQGGILGCLSCIGGGKKKTLHFLSELSPESREVIKGLTDPNPSTRMSLDTFLSHAWLGTAGERARKWVANGELQEG